MRKEISIVIPAYNAERFLPLAVESVIKQSFVDWELIIVNDGSTDNTEGTIDKLLQRDPRIKSVNQANAGSASARNNGIRCSDPACKYIAFLDADDVWEPNTLHVLWSALEQKADAIGAYGKITRIDDQGAVISTTAASFDLHEIAGVTKLPTKFETLFLFSMWCPIATPGAALLRMSAVNSVGTFDTNIPWCEDYDFYIRLGCLGNIIRIPEQVLQYRIHSNNKSNNIDFMNDSARKVIRKALDSTEFTQEQIAIIRRGYRAGQLHFLGLKIGYLRDNIRDLNVTGALAQLKPLFGCFLRYVAGRP